MKPILGFSLLELLILLCVSGILLFLAIPILRSFEIFQPMADHPNQPIHSSDFPDHNISANSFEDKDLNHSFINEVED